MNITLWILQGLVAILFFMIGSMKVFNYEKFKAQVGQDAPSKGLATFIGLSEMVGALGLVLPWGSGVLPIFTPIAALALSIVMILAIGYHLNHKHPWAKMLPAFIFLILNVIIAVGRF